MRRCIKKLTFITSLILLYFVCSPLIIYCDEVVYKNIPVFDLRDSAQKIHSMEVNVKEGMYSPNVMNKLSDFIHEEEGTKNNPEELLITYLAYLWDNRIEKLQSFYFNAEQMNVSMSPSNVGSFLRGDIRKAEKIMFLKKWIFGRYQLINVGLFSGKHQIGMLSLGVEKVGNNYYRADSWGEQDFVLSLLEYMASNFRLGVEKRFSSRLFDNSLTIYNRDRDGKLINEDPLTVYFNGEFYDFDNGWANLGQIDEKLSFIHKAIAIATDGRDEEFINLFHSDEREKLKEVLSANQQFFKIIKSAYKSQKRELKHVFTMKLGKSFLHYYFDRENPSEVKVLELKYEEGRFFLSSKISANIMTFLKSKLVVSEIIKMREKSTQMKNVMMK